jgi:hypothetical protein
MAEINCPDVEITEIFEFWIKSAANNEKNPDGSSVKEEVKKALKDNMGNILKILCE